ncbi:glyoxalase [Phormidium willei BDU 130791]|nr:glyoxalase [Phormidium willei BDU 130791]
MSLGLCNGFVTLASQQVETLVQFYTRLLGQSPHNAIPGTYAEYQVPGLRLAIFQPGTSQTAEFKPLPPGAMSLCLEVEDIYGAIAHLTAIGYPPPGSLMTTSHGREIYGYDPDGNRLILHEGASEGATG